MSIEAAPSAANIPQILIVDDEREILDITALCLKQSGYLVKTAQSAEEATELMKTEQFTAILTDVMMPGEDGISFLGRIHDSFPDLPVIIMTGFAQMQIAVNAIKHGAFDFINKPFDIPYLRKVVEKAIKYSALVQRDKQYKAELERTVATRTEELTTALRQLDYAHRALLQAANQKNEFIATISHEMRTPMNGVIGGLDLLEDAGLIGPQREYLLLVRQAAENMLSLVERMLAFSDSSSAGESVGQDVFDLGATLERIAATHQPRFIHKGLNLNVVTGEGVLQRIRCQEQQVVQLLDVLLDNACKFTEKGGARLECTLDRQGDAARLRITVSDSGIGIPVEKQATMFEPFVKGDGALTRRYGGIGLGLSIARNALHLLRGELVVQSKPGEGSSFCCVIPCEIVTKGETE